MLIDDKLIKRLIGFLLKMKRLVGKDKEMAPLTNTEDLVNLKL